VAKRITEKRQLTQHGQSCLISLRGACEQDRRSGARCMNGWRQNSTRAPTSIMKAAAALRDDGR